MKTIWKQLMIVFVIGLILGAAIGRWTVQHRHRKFENPEERFERKFKWFSRKLDLTGEQRDVIRNILKNKYAKIKTLHEQMKPQFKEIRDNSRDEIRQELTAEQQLKFDQLEEERRKKREKRKTPF